jgi:hypothetical protein
VTERLEARTEEEVLKLRFEYFKHMTTLSTAATVAVITVYGVSENALRNAAAALGGPGWIFPSMIGVAISGFSLSLLVSLWGLYLVAKAPYTNENSAAISRMLKWSARVFLLGVGLSVFSAVLLVGAQYAVAMVVIIAAITILAFFVGTRL